MTRSNESKIDLAEYQKLESRLVEAQNDAEALRQELGAFKSLTADIGHEMKAPLSALVGLFEHILPKVVTDNNPDVKKPVDAGLESLKSLVRMADGLMTNQSDTGPTVEVSEDVFSPARLMESVGHMAHMLAISKGLTFEFGLMPPQDIYVRGDEARIRQILLNLMVNAVKYTDEGSVHVAVDMSATPSDVRLIFKVKDTGAGISEDDQRDIFNRHARGALDHSLGQGLGQGLGLDICRRLADQMGADLSVDSEVGSGSEFKLSLSVPVVDEWDLGSGMDVDAGANSNLMIAHERDGDFKTILLVEDDKMSQVIIVNLLHQLFEHVDLQIDMVETAADACAVVQADMDRIDLILMDIRLPDMSGFDASKIIRAYGGAAKNIPIVAVTADDKSMTNKACSDAGISDWLAKPLSAEKMIKIVGSMLITA